VYYFRDSDALANLIDEWLTAVSYAVCAMGTEWVGFMVVDQFWHWRLQFPRLWISILNNRSPFVVTYNDVLCDPKTSNLPTEFELAYNAVNSYGISFCTHPF
jgi:hypothetical protein